MDAAPVINLSIHTPLSETEIMLVSLAAKANGYEILYFQTGGCIVKDKFDSQPRLWNPARSPGDAFTLALSVGLTVQCRNDMNAVHVYMEAHNNGPIVSVLEHFEDEAFKVITACRAVTKAAARIAALGRM